MSTSAKTVAGGSVDFPSADAPEGWAVVSLGEIVTNMQPGFACGKNNREREGIGHVRPMNVSRDGTLSLSDLKYVSSLEAERDERLLIAGDVVFNNTNSADLVGKTAYYDHAERLGFSNHMTRIRCHGKIVEPRYCAAVLHQLWRTGYFKAVCNNHVSQASVGQDVLRETEIALPPLSEQQRILASLDNLLPQVASSRDHLSRVPAILKRFRQAVLAAACSGRLTEDWRDNQDSGNASGLLEEILNDRELRWAKQQEASGKRNRPDYPKPFELNIRDLPDLPEQWAWTTLDQLIADGPQNGVYKPQTDYGQGVPIIRIEDFKDNSVCARSGLSKLRLSEGETHVYGVAPGDLLINRVNSPSHIGKCLVIQQELCPAVFESNMMRMRLAEGVRPMWIAAYLRSADGKMRLTQDAKWAVNQVSINQTDVRSTAVPLPTAAEQRQIISRVEGLFSLADAIEKRVADASSRTERLTQSILSKAFRGELVPTEAELARREGREYEPASVLLERIKKEPEKNTKPTIRSRRTAAATK